MSAAGRWSYGNIAEYPAPAAKRARGTQTDESAAGPSVRRRPATLQRTARKAAATRYSAGRQGGASCQTGQKKPRARRKTDAPPARGSPRAASHQSDKSAAAPTPKKRRSAHGADSLVTQRRAAATSSTLNAALRPRRPPSERRFRKGRLARLRELRRRLHRRRLDTRNPRQVRRGPAVVHDGVVAIVACFKRIPRVLRSGRRLRRPRRVASPEGARRLHSEAGNN